ncbi:class I SAM-dependent methyltransferase [Brevibacillus marinus]|uniref:class I SAM-dependent methyltransferase n=1 Tax=Brevibacillus marinus TaxID=2496837 RepID=UPI001F494368|nr:class I SAM-dependent methyltransferase [Brevibacillus marinus]
MFTLADFQDAVEQQLLHNRNKSLFYELPNGRLVVKPSEGTAELLKHRAKDILAFLQSAKAEGTYNQLLEDMAAKTIQLFMAVNQYLDFRRDDAQRLQNMYGEVLERVCVLANHGEVSEKAIDQLFTAHYKNLQAFLLESNGTEIFKKYKETPALFQVTCAEYTPEFQMKILEIDVNTLKQPVLDVGCGERAGFVHFLRQHGIEAYGMDRNLTDPAHFLWKLNWLESPFPANTWGTIISHMAFSNHFTHHHVKADGAYAQYARKYMEILHSLKLGGSFMYSPPLPFIEKIVTTANQSFAVETRERSTKVVRLR